MSNETNFVVTITGVPNNLAEKHGPRVDVMIMNLISDLQAAGHEVKSGSFTLGSSVDILPEASERLTGRIKDIMEANDEFNQWLTSYLSTYGNDRRGFSYPIVRAAWEAAKESST